MLQNKLCVALEYSSIKAQQLTIKVPSSVKNHSQVNTQMIVEQKFIDMLCTLPAKDVLTKFKYAAIRHIILRIYSALILILFSAGLGFVNS